jgi:hypothetical protein
VNQRIVIISLAKMTVENGVTRAGAPPAQTNASPAHFLEADAKPMDWDWEGDDEGSRAGDHLGHGAPSLRNKKTGFARGIISGRGCKSTLRTMWTMRTQKYTGFLRV